MVEVSSCNCTVPMSLLHAICSTDDISRSYETTFVLFTSFELRG